MLNLFAQEIIFANSTANELMIANLIAQQLIKKIQQLRMKLL